jgi:hypothetical protein
MPDLDLTLRFRHQLTNELLELQPDARGLYQLPPGRWIPEQQPLTIPQGTALIGHPLPLGPGWCPDCDSPFPGIHDADCPRD